MPFCLPSVGEEEIAEVVDTLRSGWITTGPKVRQFEEEVAKFLAAPGAVALSSCSAAMHVALAVAGIGAGDAVITTPMTFCSGVHVIEHVGARPILVDVEPETLNIDPARAWEEVEKGNKDPRTGKWRTRTGDVVKAMLPVHLYGHPYEADSLLKVAQDHNLVVLEDAAHALPARYKGHLIGSKAFGSKYPGLKILTALSFYATKNLTTAEGGMLLGGEELLDQARLWSLHGMSRDAFKRYTAEGSWYYEVNRPGFKYNMTDIQASIGLHQLRKLWEFHRRRQEIIQQYNMAFRELREVQIPISRGDVEHAWHLYVLRLNLETLAVDRGQFIEELRARNIGTSVHFIPIHMHEYYRKKYGFAPTDFPVAYREYQRVVSLPLYPRMTGEDVTAVIEAVRDVIAAFKR